MSDDATQSETPEPAVETLDDVISEFNVAQPEPQTPYYPQEQVAAQPQAPQTLDPFDEAQMQQFAQNNANQFGQMSGTMNSLDERLARFEQAEAQKGMDSEIKNAVDFVNKIVGHENEKWVEFQLQEKARTNPGFNNLWNNRAANPQALNKALTAIGNEMKGNTTEMLSDPQLVENQRAVNNSIQSSNSGNSGSNSLEDSLSNADEGERQAIWDRAVHGYS